MRERKRCSNSSAASESPTAFLVVLQETLQRPFNEPFNEPFRAPFDRGSYELDDGGGLSCT
jgi:hypothetical protein